MIHSPVYTTVPSSSVHFLLLLQEHNSIISFLKPANHIKLTSRLLWLVSNIRGPYNSTKRIIYVCMVYVYICIIMERYTYMHGAPSSQQPPQGYTYINNANPRLINRSICKPEPAMRFPFIFLPILSLTRYLLQTLPRKH